MKVGDLVKYEIVPYEFAEVEEHIGVIVELSRTGHLTHSARVVFVSGEEHWYDTGMLELLDENR